MEEIVRIRNRKADDGRDSMKQKQKTVRLRMLDMHAHLSGLDEKIEEMQMRQRAELELAVRRGRGIATFFSAGRPQEYEFLRPYRCRQEIFVSFGIHPWYAQEYDPSAYQEYMKECDAVGEIGMDAVWCDVPLTIQRRVFTCQLEMAEKLHKPIILHTKGQEAEIAEQIRDFPENICVHWYSGDCEDLERYLEKDCYFTFGPDFVSVLSGNAESVPEGREKMLLYQKMIREIPPDRIFAETDGISAAAWALGKEEITCGEAAAVLDQTVGQIAQIKSIDQEKMRRQIWKNLANFLGEPFSEEFSETFEGNKAGQKGLLEV